MEYEHVTHGFPPVYDENSRVLILGSLPSVKSREQQFYYGHPQNRFWKVMAAVVKDAVPATAEEKRSFLLRHGIALYDTVYECDIAGSSDSSIKNIVPTDLAPILSAAHISAIFTNGGTATRVYRRYHLPVTGIEPVPLPSTSPANASRSLDRLISDWTLALSREFVR
ncbi:MAG: DNA-deoxyinosine glycosylase [Ruminiclostridium sp.]|nr:DNA-deoxyinosine glycosylase [Ruminiclostridium sp.]